MLHITKSQTKEKKNILFRADSSSIIGTGHIMRDLVLAQSFAKAGHKIIFATQNLQGNINHNITESVYKLEILKSNDIEELDKLIKKLQINLLVIDHYKIDFKYEKKLKTKNPTLKILSFDDTYEKHYCDILLNHNIYADKKKYKALLPKDCEIRCGGKYTLLRDEFIKEKLKKRKRNSIFNIFIAMGGADHSNINIKILKVLKKFANIEVNLVTTSANQNLETLKNYCKNKTWIKLHINSNKIAKLISKSDLTIVTPSVTLNEVHFLEKPIIAIKTAQNQIEMYKYLKKKRKLVLKKFNKNRLQKMIEKFVEVCVRG